MSSPDPGKTRGGGLSQGADWCTGRNFWWSRDAQPMADGRLADVPGIQRPVSRVCPDCGGQFSSARKLRCGDCVERGQRERRLEYGRNYYATVVKINPDRNEIHQRRAIASREVVSDWLREYKTSRGCVDCGWDEHYAGLELDHMCGKTESIVKARTSIARLMAEIESGCCVVRCSTHHGVKSWAEKNRHSAPGGFCFIGDECDILPRSHPNQKRD